MRSEKTVALENNLLGVVHAILFPGQGNTSALMRGEAPKDYVLSSLQWVIENPDFTSIEITRIKSSAIRREAKALLEKARKDGKIKEVVFSAQPVQLINEDHIVEPSDICSLDEHERAKAVQRLIECIDEALEYKCEKFAFLSGKDPAILLGQTGAEAETTRSQALAQLRRSVDEICNYIKSQKPKTALVPLLEVFDCRKNAAGTNFFKECLIGPAERAETFVESMRNFYGHQEFALMIDTSHMLIAGEGPEVLKRMSSCLGHIHIANVVLNRNNPGGDVRYGDVHPAMHVADSELTDTALSGYLKALNECNYQGTLAFEIKPCGSEIPQDLAVSAISFLNSCRNSIHVNYALVNNYIFQSRRFLSEDIWDKLADMRINNPGLIQERMKKRKQRKTLAPDGKMVILAADHPARMVTNVGTAPTAMGNRFEYLGRCARVMMASSVDGLMGTADVLDDLFLLDHFYQEKTGDSFLDNKVLIACMNRGGLAGAKYEMFDRKTAFQDVKKVKELKLDGAKMLLRLAVPDIYDRYCIQTMEDCSRIVEACNEISMPAFMEPLPVKQMDGQYKVIMQADELIKVIGVAAGLSSSSANMWMKIPYVPDYNRVAQSFSGPILMLGGASTGYPVDVIEQFACGMGEGENVRGAMVGRNVLFPGDDDPAAVAEAICNIVHKGISANEAVKSIPALRGSNMDLLPKE
jgi:DhnA family fructose-bisphosphate aldolase class Ia/sugar phosphate isomerase/epimerase